MSAQVAGVVQGGPPAGEVYVSEAERIAGLTGRNGTAECFSCWGEISVCNLIHGEVDQCPDCGAEFEVMEFLDEPRESEGGIEITVVIQPADEPDENWGE